MTTIYSRQVWKAEYADGFGLAPLPAKEVWLHHSATTPPPASASLELDAAAVRLLEQIGQARFGGGISYTFAVCPSGRVFQGHSVDRRGAHTKGRNSIARAIVLIGNYEQTEPSQAQVDAVATLLSVGHAAEWWVTPRLAGGHRDAPGASTACPGARAHALIPEINRRAAAPHPEEDDMTPDQAKMLAEVHRQLLAPLDYREPYGPSTTHYGHSLATRAELARVEVKLDRLLDALGSAGVAPTEFTGTFTATPKGPTS